VADVILILNAGSSSLKFSLFAAEPADNPRQLLRGNIDGLPGQARFLARNTDGTEIGRQDWTAPLDHEGALKFLLQWIGSSHAGQNRIIAAGHRIVHGGTKFNRPVRITQTIAAELEALIPLAPLHQPHNVAPIHALTRLDPVLAQVACFDTAFHRTQPVMAQLFALPKKYAEAGIIRYGFHGLSYEYIATALPAIDPKAANGRVIVAHLGNGASMCAMQHCRSVATSMSFTPLDGLVMGTRCGSIDPGVLLHLMRTENKDAAQLEDLLYHQSGLLGVSGVSSDMRTLLQSSDPPSVEAISLFVYRAVREAGSLAAALGGLDALVFTGGIGENAPQIRARICDGLRWLGLDLDAGTNDSGAERISREGSRVAAWVIPTDEELIIARHTLRILAAAK
jgi:acetate kinase